MPGSAADYLRLNSPDSGPWPSSVSASRRWLITATAVVLSGLACSSVSKQVLTEGGAKTADLQNDSPPRWFTPDCAKRASSASPGRGGVTPDSLLETWVEAPARVRVGESVELKLKIRGQSGRPVRVGIAGPPPAFDLVIRTENGDKVWSRWQTLPGGIERGYGLALSVYDLEANEVLEFEDRWDGTDRAGKSLPPGRYYVQGSLMSSSACPTKPIPIVVFSCPADALGGSASC